jgi:hypothetical protein
MFCTAHLLRGLARLIEFSFFSGTRSADILLDDIDNIRLAHASTECESTERELSATGDCDLIFVSNGEFLSCSCGSCIHQMCFTLLLPMTTRLRCRLSLCVGTLTRPPRGQWVTSHYKGCNSSLRVCSCACVFSVLCSVFLSSSSSRRSVRVPSFIVQRCPTCCSVCVDSFFV